MFNLPRRYNNFKHVCNEQESFKVHEAKSAKGLERRNT